VHHVSPQGSWTGNIKNALDELSAERVTAVIFEPQMGSLGIIPEPDDLRALARLCRDAGVHLIADEVTTGCGRTGAMSRTLDLGIEPDLLVLGKNLTSGYVPVAALMVSAALYELAANPDPPRFLPAGSATDGHPVACAAGLAVLGTYHRDDILAHVRRTGAMLRERLETVHAKWIAEGSVAGAGLMIHFPLLQADGEPWTFPALGAFRTECENNGLLVSASMHGAWVVPPLTATKDDCAEIADLRSGADARRRRVSTRREPLDPADATKLVLDQMRAVLDNPELSEDDHFFDWGGDSILAARVMQRVNEETGLDLATSLLFAFPTAAELSEAVIEESQAE
jgi:adenosylmethionine-8-amino-7-oxononanoate aminotransferase/acyl carrier protein